MNRLANALLFAVVVITAFVLEARSAYPQYSPGHLLARVMQTARPAEAPVYVGSLPEPPAFDEEDVQRVVERAERAQRVLTRVETRYMERQARIQARVASAKCKIVRLDQ